MDLCHRCQHALSFAEHEYEYERFSDPSASGKLDLTIGHKYASPEEQEIISTEVLREMRQYLDVYPDYPNLRAAADQGCQFCALLRSAMISKETRLDRNRMLEKILPLDVMLRISFFQQERLKIDGNSRAAQWTLKVKVHYSMDPSKFDVIGKPQWSAVIMSIYFPVSIAKNREFIIWVKHCRVILTISRHSVIGRRSKHHAESSTFGAESKYSLFYQVKYSRMFAEMWTRGICWITGAPIKAHQSGAWPY